MIPSTRTRGLGSGWLLLCILAAAPSCATLRDVPDEAPPLRDMEEPLPLFEEPADEAARRALPAGTFTGIVPGDARHSLDAMLSEPDAVLVARVVENSPADIAGIRKGDLLLETRAAGAGEGGGGTRLRWPSQWRRLELETRPGEVLRVILDRAGREMEAHVIPIARVRPAGRRPAERLREEERVGVVVRSATEVEARAAGLGPGGGAVIVGLSRASPWREAGLRFGDLVVEIAGEKVDHPQVVLNAIRKAGSRQRLTIVYVRDGETRSVKAAVSRRARAMRHIHLPLLFSYERERGESDLSLLLGIVRYRATTAAWRLRLLWLFSFEGGVADRLEEVKS